MKLIGILLISIALAGCNTQPGTVGGFISGANLQAHNDKRCQGYGFRPGTDAYGLCRLQIDEANRTRASRR